MVVFKHAFLGKVAGGVWGALLISLCLVGLEVEQAGAYALPTTGATQCYSDTAQIACPKPGEDYYGQDGNYRAGTAMHYTVQGASSDMVLDDVTGLTWLRTPYGRDYYVDAAAYCEALSLNGYDDWRVPSELELATILDIGINAPKWNAVFDGGYSQAGYFSSNAYSGDLTQQIGVIFNYGTGIIHSSATLGYMRCVRGEALSSSFSGSTVVTDLSTGLMWQNTGNETKYTWKEALAYCEGLSLGGYTDWRLPNLKELLSIVDYTKNNPAISAPFTAVSGDYWTSSNRYDTSAPTAPQNGMYVDFSDGYFSYWFSKTLYPSCARCVRGGIVNVPVAVLAHTPASPTTARTATITVGGAGVSGYMYRLDDGDWSEATSIATPISLSGLSVGAHTLAVLGQNSDGVWQDLDAPTTATWTILAPGAAAFKLLLLAK